MIGIELVLACAPAVAPETMMQIIKVESRGDVLAININRRKGENKAPKLKRKPADAADAALIVKEYIAQGYSVDMGLTQFNSNNLRGLGYQVEDMFEPCKNIAAGARVLSSFYTKALPKYEGEQAALQAALSAYNTGSFINGFNNGYVANYIGTSSASLQRVPAINIFTADTAIFATTKKEKAMSESKQLSEQIMPVISEKEDDAQTPGVQVEYTADQAEESGAFEETAMTEGDAWESNKDLEIDPLSTGVIVGGKLVNHGEI